MTCEKAQKLDLISEFNSFGH